MFTTIETPYGDEINVRVEVVSFTQGYPSKIYADPDDCYEGEPDQLEFVLYDDEDKLLNMDDLTDRDKDRITSALIDAHYEYMKHGDY